MNKENVVCVYIHNGILFIHKKEGNPAIWDNMDETGEHYSKWTKPDKQRQILYHLYVVSKKQNKNQKKKLKQSKIVVGKDWGERRETGEMQVKGYKLMCSMATIINYMVGMEYVKVSRSRS